jgi:hypothetical protein
LHYHYADKKGFKMNHAVINFLIKDYPSMKLKLFHPGNKLNLFAIVYAIWIVISIMLAYIQPYKYAAYFTDLPNNIRNISPLILSITYLVLFIPAVALMILFGLSILFFVVWNV